MVGRNRRMVTNSDKVERYPASLTLPKDHRVHLFDDT